MNQTRRKLNKASEFAAIAQLLQLFHLFPAISSICVLSSRPFLLFFLSPLPALTNLHVSFRWKITPFKNLLYVLPDFSFILFHVPHSCSLDSFFAPPPLQFCSLSSLAASANSLGPFLFECVCVCCSAYTCKRVYCICSECCVSTK